MNLWILVSFKDNFLMNFGDILFAPCRDPPISTMFVCISRISSQTHSIDLLWLTYMTAKYSAMFFHQTMLSLNEYFLSGCSLSVLFCFDCMAENNVPFIAWYRSREQRGGYEPVYLLKNLSDYSVKNSLNYFFSRGGYGFS